MNNVVNNEYIVYAANLGGYCMYIGSGKSSRWKHLYSGRSTCQEANKHILNGGYLEVSIIESGLSKEDSLDLENYLIRRHNPKWNCIPDHVRDQLDPYHSECFSEYGDYVVVQYKTEIDRRGV